MTEQTPPPQTTGSVLHRPRSYDLLVWLLTLGRERAFRERVVRLARLEAGESVLDVGCGTGTLTIAARRRVGPAGFVCGIDASPEMIASGRRTAAKAASRSPSRTRSSRRRPFRPHSSMRNWPR